MAKPMYYVLPELDGMETAVIVKRYEEPTAISQGPFTTLAEAQDADWDAQYVDEGN
jgi:hypothetical protein